MCILECHLDRSGRFLDRASSLHTLPPTGGPRQGKGFTNWNADHGDLILHVTGAHSRRDSRAKGPEKAEPRLGPHSTTRTESGPGLLPPALGGSTGLNLCPGLRGAAKGIANMASASGKAREPRAQLPQGRVAGRAVRREACSPEGGAGGLPKWLIASHTVPVQLPAAWGLRPCSGSPSEAWAPGNLRPTSSPGPRFSGACPGLGNCSGAD